MSPSYIFPAGSRNISNSRCDSDIIGNFSLSRFRLNIGFRAILDYIWILFCIRMYFIIFCAYIISCIPVITLKIIIFVNFVFFAIVFIGQGIVTIVFNGIIFRTVSIQIALIN